MPHLCDREGVHCKEKDGKLIVYDKEGTHFEVGYCPFCGHIAPERLQICFKCKKQSKYEYEFMNYYIGNKEIYFCELCRKKLDVKIEESRVKVVEDFLRVKKETNGKD